MAWLITKIVFGVIIGFIVIKGNLLPLDTSMAFLFGMGIGMLVMYRPKQTDEEETTDEELIEDSAEPSQDLFEQLDSIENNVDNCVSRSRQRLQKKS